MLTAAHAQPLSDEAIDEEQADVITVYGTSNPLPAFDYPGQVSVITREDVDTFAPSSISDLLRDVAGLDFAGGPRRTGETPSLRGLSGENVLILLDGARQSFISAHDGRFFADPDLIQTAEVVKGPASALYGSGAVGGVLALETVDAADFLEGDETMGARLRGAYQSVNEETLASVTGFLRHDAFDGLVSLGARQSGDIALGSGADLPADDDIQTALVKGGYAFTNDLRAELSYQRFDNTAIEPNNGQGTSGTGDSILDRDVEKDIVSETWRLGVDFDPVSPWIDARLTIYDTANSVDEFDKTIPRTTVRDITTTGISARNAARFDWPGVETTLTLGGDWYRDEQTGTDTETADGTRGGVPNGESEFTGLFAQLEAVIDQPLGLPGELLVIPGVRYDSYESRSDIDPQANSDEAVSPRLAASYGPVSWFRVFGGYSEGFRAPSINELYLDDVHFSLPHPVLFNPAQGQFTFVNNNFVPNPDLIPEEATTIEIGAGVDFQSVIMRGDRLQGKLSYFDTEVENLINLSVDVSFDPTCFAPPFFPCTAGVSRAANVDTAELDGFEGELRYDSDRFEASLTYASIEGVDVATGSDLGALTPDRLAVNAAVKLPEWDARIGTRIQVAEPFSRRVADGAGGFDVTDAREGYGVVDLYASWSPEALNGVRIDAGVNNVFDEDYERVFEGVSEPGRNVRIAASWRFGR